MKNARDISGYKGMWVFALFDLPVKKKQDRRNYARFRKKLLEMGYYMLQFSVYARYYSGKEAGEAHMGTIAASLPPKGEVRILTVTDVQFGKMQVFYGRNPRKTEEPPSQFELF